jgi:hypothetical protein
MRRSRYTLASDQKLYLLLSASGRKTVVRMIDGRLVRIFVVGDFASAVYGWRKWSKRQR